MPDRIFNSMLRRTFSSFLVLFFTYTIGHTQNYSPYNWTFGNSTSWISFNKSDSVPVLNSGQFAMGTGGAATATNPSNGELLFYSDGANVYDASHQLMMGGAGLNGNNLGNQPVAICNVPGSPDEYYIFSNSASYTTPGTIYYTVVDMTQFGNAVFPSPALGAVNTSIKAKTTPLNNTTEGMIIVSKSDLSGFWLISKQNGLNDVYNVLNIDVGMENITMAGTYNLGDPIIAGNFSYNSATGKIAVSSQNENRNIQILQLNNATGALSYDSEVLNTGYNNLTGEAIYDTEWSADGQYLYISIHGGGGFNGDLLQYNTTATTTTLASVLPGVIANSYGIKMGPDGNIYHLFLSGSEYHLGRINEPDSVASAVNYEIDPLGNVNFNGRQFPEFLPEYDLMITADFTYSGTCANVPTQFFPDVTPIADTILWDFGDGNTGNEWSPIHTYDGTASPYTVTMTAIVAGQATTVTKPVNITSFDVQITLVSDTVACRDEFPPPRGNSNPTQFSVTATFQGSAQPTNVVWSNGDTGPTLTPDSAGFYYVVATVGSCQISASVNVQEYGLISNTQAMWYFGQEAGIDFNTTPPTPLSDGVMTANEGCTAVSDQNGQILFYTDGSSIYDKNHTEVATNIGGDPDATQSVIAVPFPGDQTMYYIFTTEAVYGTNTYKLKYTTFDLKLNNGTGDVVSSDNLLYTKSTERLTSNGTWLIAHEYGSNTFLAYPLLQTGIGLPVLSSIGSAHSTSIERNGQGYMKLSQDGTRIAVALSNNDNSNFVELFNFDNATGTISNYTPLDLGAEGALGQVYGVEFSPSGTKLYATVKNAGSSLIYEYRSDTLSKAKFIGTIPSPAFAGELGAIQYAPDGQLYVAINGSPDLGTISVQEDTTQTSTFNPNGFTLASGKESRLGLPNFVQSSSNQTGQAAMSVPLTTCINDTVTVSGIPTSSIDGFQWTVLNPGGSLVFSSMNQTDSFVPTSVGTYKVSLRVTNRCGLDTLLTQDMEVEDIPPAFDSGISSWDFICDDSGITLAAYLVADPSYTYQWSSGETTNSIQVLDAGYYTITVTNQAGCSRNYTTQIIDVRPQIDLGPDLTICEGDFLAPLDPGFAGGTYAWTENGASPSTSQTRAVDTSIPGVYDYIVTVQDPITLCTTSDSVTITINAAPQVTVTPTNSPGCNNNQGQLDIDITSTGLFSYIISGPTPSFGTDITGPSGTINASNLAVGFYNVTVTDEISGCNYVFTAGIQDVGAGFTIGTPNVTPSCGTADVTIPLNGAPNFPVSYTITDQVSGNIINGSASGNIVETLNAPSSYIIDVTDATMCTQSSGPFNTTENTRATLSVTLDNCTNPPTLVATSNASTPNFIWSGGTIISQTDDLPNKTSTVEIPPLSNIWTVTVKDTGPLCDSTVSITVNPIQLQSATLSVSGNSCDGQLTLSANITPSGNYSYQWIRDGSNISGQIGPNLTATTSGDYSLRVRNQQSGCDVYSDTVSVQVFEPITMTLSSTSLCEDQPFTLTAETVSTRSVTYSWTRDGIAITGETDSTLVGTQDGTYEVTAVTDQGCTAVASMPVQLSPVDYGNLPVSVIICPLETDPQLSQADLDPGGSFVSYLWMDDSGNQLSTSRIYTATAEGVYTVELTNQFGCTTEDTVRVTEDCIPKVFGPNAFRPNGVNNEFYLFTKYLTDFEIFIYDRWGSLVFHSDQKDFRWDGKLNGQLLPAGTYAYVVKFKSEFKPFEGLKEKHGGVILLR